MDDSRTISGKPVSDPQIEEWAHEAEAGYEVGRLKRRGRPRIGSDIARVAAVRLNPELSAALSERAEKEHSTRSEVVREALEAYLKSA
jgi:hypothetical protein